MRRREPHVEIHQTFLVSLTIGLLLWWPVFALIVGWEDATFWMTRAFAVVGVLGLLVWRRHGLTDPPDWVKIGNQLQQEDLLQRRQRQLQGVQHGHIRTTGKG